MPLLTGISGVRGVLGNGLSPEVVVRFAAAFAAFSNRGKIVIGRDGRVTGKIIGNLVSSTLLSMGCDVVALGVAPTPTIALAVRQLNAAGGIAITASHNPMEWNGLKFVGPSGMFLTSAENEKLSKLYQSGEFHYSSWEKIGRHIADDSYLRQHIDLVLNLPYINPTQIRDREFTVVVDCVNAAGCVIVPELLRMLGCNVIELNCEPIGVFGRAAEPLPEHLGMLCQRVRETKADLGIAVDPDVDRLVLITEKGEPFGEEYTITTVVKYVLEKTVSNSPTAPVVVNLSTTRAVEEVARELGTTVVRTSVGEINVAQKMKELGSIIGGEGNGGVILPAINYGRDAITGIGLVLQQLAEFGRSLSHLKATLPQYHIVKTKIDIGERDPDRLLENVLHQHRNDGHANLDDGLRLDFQDSWVHLRKSNTEPIIRIIAEGTSLQEAQQLVDRFRQSLLS